MGGTILVSMYTHYGNSAEAPEQQPSEVEPYLQVLQYVIILCISRGTPI